MPGGGIRRRRHRGHRRPRGARLWLATGFYTVQPNEVGLNMVFGKFTRAPPRPA